MINAFDLPRQTARRLTIATLLFISAVTVAAQPSAVYRNPVATGDYPDPSVIRVGRDYWATATSSEWGPEFPLLHSRDLVNWNAVGALFQQPPAWSAGSYWAPELSQYRGRFYVYYVARKKGGPLCVAVATASSVRGPYKDHGPLVCQEVGSIDGFPITDENGQRYLLWKEDGNSVSKPTPIWAQRLSADGTRLVGERKEILRNTEAWEKHATLPYGDLVEGPAVVRRGGWFYMFYSGNFCCARDCNYMLGVARSRKLLGTWEKNPRNPLVAGNENWKCPGHGTVVTDPTGRDWLLYHAYHAKDSVYVGRQAVLDEVRWHSDGWPTINEGRGPSGRAQSPLQAHQEMREYKFFDDFNTPRLRSGWQWPHASKPSFRLLPRGKGWLEISSKSEGPGNAIGSVLARSTTVGDYIATTVIDAQRLPVGAKAGISAFGDAENALGASVGSGQIQLWRREKNESRTVTAVAAPSSPLIHLRMTAREGHLFRFAFSSNGRVWIDVGEELDGYYLPPWDRGVRVALVTDGAIGSSALYDSLRIVPTKR